MEKAERQWGSVKTNMFSCKMGHFPVHPLLLPPEKENYCGTATYVCCTHGREMGLDPTYCRADVDWKQKKQSLKTRFISLSLHGSSKQRMLSIVQPTLQLYNDMTSNQGFTKCSLETQCVRTRTFELPKNIWSRPLIYMFVFNQTQSLLLKVIKTMCLEITGYFYIS